MSNDNFFPLVSIVIPVYNGSNYLNQAIDSALAQTYKNIEIIVVNDGSKDDGATDAIAKSYGDKIRYFHKENGGCGSALNVGLTKIKGDYFSWLSHDDLYKINKIEHQINTLKSLDNLDTIIYGGYKLIDNNSNEYATVDPRNVLPKEKLNIALMPLLRGLIHGCALLIPSKLFKEIGNFNEKLLCTQDYDLWFKFLNKYPIHFDNELLTLGREHPNKSTYLIPTVVNEGDELWSGFLENISKEQMIEMDNSEYLFFKNISVFLSTTPYKKAYNLALKKTNIAFANIKISIIIPYYNRISWTIEAVKSVLDQTHQNFEIILINDGSTKDDTQLIELIKHDNRINHYIFETNQGPAKARNFGITKASGEYIAFLDSDDLFMPHKLEKQLKYMEDYQVVFSHTSYERIDYQRKLLNIIDVTKANGMIFPKIILHCPIATPTVMVKTKIMQSESFPEDIKIAEDICLWISLSSKYLCGAISEPLSKVRITANTTIMNEKNHLRGVLNIINYVMNNEYYSQFNVQIKELFHVAYLSSKKIAIQGEPVANKLKDSVTFIPMYPQKFSLYLIPVFFKSIYNEGISKAINKAFQWIKARL